MPFIIDDKRRSRYLRGIKEWQADRYELADVVMEVQDRLEAQIELQKRYAHTQRVVTIECFVLPKQEKVAQLSLRHGVKLFKSAD